VALKGLTEGNRKMPENTRDVIVIGAGPGGYVAAIRMAQLGLKVTVVEKEKLGGVCLNWGCIPSKAMIYGASLYEKVKDASKMGIVVDNIRVELPTLVSWKDDVVKKLTGGIGQLFKNHGIETVYGTASFKDKNTLNVTDSSGKKLTLSAKNFLIATGSSSVELPGMGFDHTTIIDSTDALALSEIPKHLVLIGGGVIGLELGIMYAKLGAKVSVVELLPQLLPGVDKEIADTLRRSLKKRQMDMYLESKAKSIKVQGEKASLILETPDGEKTLEADKVLVAVGRRPNSKNLGLESIGVKLDARGFIPVDKQLRTNIPNIFAIGDVVGAPLLAHKASKEGLVAAEVIAGKKDELDYRAMPAAIFTDPEIATVGLMEDEAKAAGHQVKVGKFPFAASGRALSMDEPEGFVKVIADAKTDELLGVHMIGPEVSELIAEAALAIEMGATSEDLALTVHTHPTLPESLMEAAEALHGQAIHIYQGKGSLPSPKPSPVKV
jgi:dihydrolipoamide dehydrogenase